jgi:asparagine synthase (glutamine-hydrolysing)
LVFNGEVYNFRTLRAELEGRGRRFRSGSDTEVVLEALATWGSDALLRFNGMFALAWYDTVSETLLLARDALGIKPLYYLDHPRALVFGSQYNQLLRHPLCDRSAIRADVLSLYLRLGYVPSPYGLVAGTAQLEAGTFLTAGPGRASRVARYRDLPAAGGPYLEEPDACRTVARDVAAAVQRQLVSDVPTGAFLSGGVDSPLVAAHMQAAHREPVPMFTIGSTDPALDESAVAARYAKALGVDHHVRTFRATDALDIIDDMAAAFSEPFADHSALPTMLVSSVAREHVKVVLAGDGGDEVFWGYPRFRKVLRARPWFRLPRAARVAGYAAGKIWPTQRRRPPKGVTFPTLGDWYFDSHSGLRSSDLMELCPSAVATPQDFTLYDLNGAPDHTDLAQWLRANELRGHLEMMLTKVDRASMFYGLEVRVPLLDWEVVEGATRLAPDSCMRGDIGKIVLRQALAEHVDPASIPIQKRGFDVPVGRWLGHELAPRLADVLLERDPFPEGLFDRRVLARYVEGHGDGTGPGAQAVWNLLSLQLWADTHLRRPPVKPSATRVVPLAGG